MVLKRLNDSQMEEHKIEITKICISVFNLQKIEVKKYV